MRPTILLHVLCMSNFTVVFKDDELCQRSYGLDIRIKLYCVLSVRETPDPTVYVCSHHPPPKTAVPLPFGAGSKFAFQSAKLRMRITGFNFASTCIRARARALAHTHTHHSEKNAMGCKRMVIRGRRLSFVARELNPAPCNAEYASFDPRVLKDIIRLISWMRMIQMAHVTCR